MKKHTVSVIIPTKNSASFIEACLKSIKKQTYPFVEIIIVDNFSQDDTIKIAKKYTKNIYSKGPERSAQRNFGCKKSTGTYLLFIDSDMVVSSSVIQEAVKKVSSSEEIKAIIIPEKSFGDVFWARCKDLEKSFYIGVKFIEAARFFEKDAFLSVGGYDTDLISGEDWYMSQKMEKCGKIERIKNIIYHNEGNITLLSTVKKKYYYAKHFAKYMNLKDNSYIKDQTSIFKRYKIFFSQPKKLFKDPILGIGMLFLKTCEFGFGGIGYLLSVISNRTH